MRVLFSTVSPARYMRPPLLGDEQINCGPDWPDQTAPDGRVRSLKTGVGAYDLAAVAARLPREQAPDLVVCLVDASRRNLPGNLGAFRCPRVLLVADTHHLEAPLTGMLAYATSEAFDRVVLVYDRHHAEFFRTAGVPNLFWFPGLTFPHSDVAVAAARKAVRLPRIAFVGQAGRFHPRRQALLAEMRARGLAVEQRALPQEEALGFYGASLLGFNASLNGDLNLRVFEILAAGGALLTDRLAPASGLSAILAEGHEFFGYGVPEELARSAAEALASPNATGAIGAAGARWFDAHLGEVRRRADFRRVAFDGVEVPAFAFSAEERTSVFFPGDAARFRAATAFYEQVQELHRSRPVVRVALGADAPREIERMGATLPGVRCVALACAEDADAVVLGSDDELGRAGSSWRILWAPDGVKPPTVTPPGVVAKGGGLMLRAVDEGAAAKHLVLVTDDPESGGVAQYNHAVLMALVRAGYRVSCIQSRTDNPLVTRQREAGVAFRWIDYHTGREFGRTLEDATVAEALFREDQPDLVLFSDCCPLSNFAARRAAKRLGVPFVSIEGFVGAYLARDFADRLAELAGQYAAARAVVAVSEENLALLRNRFGLPERRGVVIHYGRPARFFGERDLAVRARLRAEVGIPKDSVVCFTAARIARVKGYAHQLEAAARLVGEAPGCRLHWVWAGEGEQREELAREIARRGLTSRVHLLGHRWDVADWYDAADLFVLPSHLEGMPLAIMEAMAKGLPVIATAVSGIPEELGDTGKLLPSPDENPAGVVAGLVATIRLWAGDDVTRRAAGERSRARACALFREEQMVEKTLALVRRALAASATESAESPAAGLLAEARELAKQGKFAPAFAKTMAAVEKDRNCAEAHALLAQLALARPNGAAMAVKSFRAALALDPNATETELRLAATLGDLGRWPEARESLDRVLARQPQNSDAQRLMERARAAGAGATARTTAEAPAVGHVLLYSDDAGEGAEAEIANALSRALGGAGYRVSAARSRRGVVGVEATARGGRMHWIAYDTREGVERAMTDEETLALICTAERPDLVVFADTAADSSLGAKRAAARLGLRSVVWCGALAPAAPRSRGGAALAASRLARATAVAVRSNAMLELLRYEYGLAPDRGVIVATEGAELVDSLVEIVRQAQRAPEPAAGGDSDLATPFLHVVHRGGQTQFREFQCYAPNRGLYGSRLIAAALDGLELGDCEFAVSTGDQPGAVGGLTTFSYSTTSGDFSRVCPDFVFDSWPEVQIDDYEKLRAELAEAGRSVPETARVGWIGALLVPARERLVELARANPEALDAIPMQWDRSNPARHTSARFLSLSEQVRRWKYLIDVEGHGWSARLKTFFFSGRVVFIAERPWQEWYFEHLVPWKHFVPVRRDLGDLVENFRILEADPQRQRDLVAGAREFAERHLTRAAAVERWRTLLRAHFGRGGERSALGGKG